MTVTEHTPERPPPRDVASPEDYREGILPGLGGTVRAAWLVALLGVVALLLGRAVSPALLGVWVGVDRAVTAAQLVAATFTQLFAILAVGLTVGLLLAVSRSRWPIAIRAFAVGAVCLVTLAVGTAMFLRLPEVSGIAAGSSASVLAVLVGLYGMREPRARAACLIVVASGAAGVMRMVAIGIGYGADASGSRVLGQIASVVATVDLLIHAGAAAMALGWIAWQRRRPAFLLIGVVLLVAAAGIVVVGVLGAAPDAAGWSVLTNRAIGQLITAPAPLAPPIVHGYVRVLTFALAVAVLAKRWPVPMLTAAVSLALTAQAAPEAPLGSMALTLAALLVSAAVDLRLRAPAAGTRGQSS
ncbi:MAG: hypothetical protein JRI23_26450 [Deltaproteobacteria bacterium]|jgi:hypothetical protein|nr:hypothetical protein [Deltaproteobacteria bacterium]MBW2535577.1 hypothetical protein [Deltaproteobacteria bacterium]